MEPRLAMTVTGTGDDGEQYTIHGYKRMLPHAVEEAPRLPNSSKIILLRSTTGTTLAGFYPFGKIGVTYLLESVCGAADREIRGFGSAAAPDCQR